MTLPQHSHDPLFFQSGALHWKPFEERLRSPWWARGGHAQTLFGYWLRRKTPLLPYGKRVQITLPDQDVLDGLLLDRGSDSRGVLCLFHGLGGSNQSSYMLQVGGAAHREGWTVLLMNHRGCGKGITLPCRNPYHSGRGEDVGAVIEWCRNRWPQAYMVAMGFSLGGSAVLHLMTRKSGSHLPDVAFSVNAPLNTGECAENLDIGFNYLYSRTFVDDCYRTLQQKHQMGWLQELPDRKRIRRLIDFDALHTAPKTGHGSVTSFYEYCSTGPFLNQINKPTVLFSSADDPIAMSSHYKDFQKSPQVMLHLEDSGGHIGYVSKNKHWLERALLHYLAQVPTVLRDFTSLSTSADAVKSILISPPKN